MKKTIEYTDDMKRNIRASLQKKELLNEIMISRRTKYYSTDDQFVGKKQPLDVARLGSSAFWHEHTQTTAKIHTQWTNKT
ncbi:10241_t:CDS:2 [Dentiscutata erythropus]|uniref:10241_t:CDS:1 n=1 Tax=Dentiscutata erythropus TaxID=1348616 RepID=A0A9N8ZT77_9GLOM|nr:10241_t:CDS:2 [Dentiscutata erythropus]